MPFLLLMFVFDIGICCHCCYCWMARKVAMKTKNDEYVVVVPSVVLGDFLCV